MYFWHKFYILILNIFLTDITIYTQNIVFLFKKEESLTVSFAESQLNINETQCQNQIPVKDRHVTSKSVCRVRDKLIILDLYTCQHNTVLHAMEDSARVNVSQKIVRLTITRKSFLSM